MQYGIDNHLLVRIVVISRSTSKSPPCRRGPSLHVEEAPPSLLVEEAPPSKSKRLYLLICVVVISKTTKDSPLPEVEDYRILRVLCMYYVGNLLSFIDFHQGQNNPMWIISAFMYDAVVTSMLWQFSGPGTLCRPSTDRLRQ